MLTYLWSWLQGYAVVHLSGGGQERFLNLVMQQDIEVYETVWLAEDLLELKTDCRTVGELKKIAAVCGCEMRIRRRQGLPYAWRYLRGRKTLVIGMMLFVMGLLAASQLVFVVRVAPQEALRTLEESRVMDEAAELGLKPGAVYRRLDSEALAEELRHRLPEISWVYIERQGVIVNIKVAERAIYPEELENATVGAIWADRDGLIEEVLIKHGQAAVSHGDTVRKGTLLVAPLADGRADAIIRARVWYQGYGEGKMQEEVINRGRDVGTVYKLYKNKLYESRSENESEINNKSENLVENRSKTENKSEMILWGGIGYGNTAADTTDGTYIAGEETEYEINLGRWRVTVVAERRHEEGVSCIERSEEQAKQAALAEARESLRAQSEGGGRLSGGKVSGGKLLHETVEYRLLAGGIWAADVGWECLEEIGERRWERDGT